VAFCGFLAPNILHVRFCSKSAFTQRVAVCSRLFPFLISEDMQVKSVQYSAEHQKLTSFIKSVHKQLRQRVIACKSFFKGFMKCDMGTVH